MRMPLPRETSLDMTPIVVGVRASEVRPDFVAANERLLDFVRAGGTLIVQYQQGVYAAGKLPPFPVSAVGTGSRMRAGR